MTQTPTPTGGVTRHRGSPSRDSIVPEAEFDSYYGRPVVKAAPWEHDIAYYLFTGGVAAGSALLGAGADLTSWCAQRPLPIDESASSQLTPESRAMIGDFAEILRGLNDWSVSAIDAAARAFAEARGLKLGKVAQPLRAALTGRTVSPGIFEVMVLIGKQEALDRLSDQVMSS